MAARIRNSARQIMACALAAALCGCAGHPIWFAGTEYSSPGSLFTGGDKPPPVVHQPHRQARTAHHAAQWDLREYRQANLALDSAYRKLEGQMDLQQQLDLSHEQTVWLNAEEQACTRRGVTSYGCAARRSYARAAVLSARKVVPETVVAATPLPSPNLPILPQPGVPPPPPVAPPSVAPTPPATAQTYFVPVTAMPWLWQAGGKNQAFSFGYPNGTSPVVVPLDGLGARPGGKIEIQYAGGQITIGDGGPRADASGYMGLTAGAGPLGAYPSKYVPGSPVNLGALVGVFTDGDGNILGHPFAVGAGRTRKTVPPGATRLQLGINDDVFGGNSAATRNSGGFAVRVFRGPG